MAPRGTSLLNTRRGVLLLSACAATSALLLAGCASTGSGPGGHPGDDPSAETVVLQVERVGGFAPVCSEFARVPELTVYADGRAFTRGPQIAIFPPPALPNLLMQDLSDEQLATLLDAAREAGLLAEPPDYGRPAVADAMTTIVTVRSDGTAFEHSAYALGISRALPGAADPPNPLVGPDAKRARDALSDFIEFAHQAVANAGNESQFRPDAFAVIATPASEAPTSETPASETPPSDEPGGPGIEPTTMPWPIVASLESASECLVVDGTAAESLLAVLEQANTMTRFEQGGQVFEVTVRPLLPGETCATVS